MLLSRKLKVLVLKLKVQNSPIWAELFLFTVIFCMSFVNLIDIKDMCLFLSAEYKDVWTVENKWTKHNALKPQFKKVRKEIALNNELIEEFLQESLIMKQLNHCNILSLFGVSVHYNKPCVILPLMTNGDLRNYLKFSNLVILFVLF